MLGRRLTLSSSSEPSQRLSDVPAVKALARGVEAQVIVSQGNQRALRGQVQSCGTSCRLCRLKFLA